MKLYNNDHTPTFQLQLPFAELLSRGPSAVDPPPHHPKRLQEGQQGHSDDQPLLATWDFSFHEYSNKGSL